MLGINIVIQLPAVSGFFDIGTKHDDMIGQLFFMQHKHDLATH